jgi:hypothetical protein
MSIVVRLDSHVCPRCALPVTAVHEPEATAVRYDVAGWARRCQRTDCDGPLACPWMKRTLQTWLDEHRTRIPPL